MNLVSLQVSLSILSQGVFIMITSKSRFPRSCFVTIYISKWKCVMKMAVFMSFDLLTLYNDLQNFPQWQPLCSVWFLNTLMSHAFAVSCFPGIHLYCGPTWRSSHPKKFQNNPCLNLCFSVLKVDALLYFQSLWTLQVREIHFSEARFRLKKSWQCNSKASNPTVP